ncbi:MULTISPECIES: putative toxin-antitoxin system toxin component, PIN family [unclassified Spirosoma]|uniref:PIN domain-containing protein n=1 Tax=unclassified Spirosoma TaxID=2621999 RepID=UPI000963AD0D|nr:MULTISPECIES: PIN domain-containing protein [unclassified Spirosoma]MBN8822035.1 PIN domain-containing protein [Spirosoma sp.]OJW80444.1 MAG: nucleotide-binding protein [Spirosoma sp. 48-14]
MKVVLDINVLLISLPVSSPYRPIFDALKAGKFDLALSNDILFEYHEKLAEKTSAIVADNVIKLLLSLDNCLVQPIYFEWGLMHNDPDDNKYVDCALVANADHLVSEDRHFSILRNIAFPHLSVIRIDEFLGWLLSR